MERGQNGNYLRAKHEQQSDRTPEQEALAGRDAILDRFVDDLLAQFTDPASIKDEDEEAAKWSEVQDKTLDEVRAYLLSREDIFKAASDTPESGENGSGTKPEKKQPDPEWLAYALRWYELRGL